MTFIGHASSPRFPLFLGAGGSIPRIDVVDGCGNISVLHELASGHSAYALAVNPSQNAIAIGTKGGAIRILTIPPLESDAVATSSVSLRQGSSILSVCFLTDSLLVASDAAGRCLLWRPDAPDLPKGALETPAGAVVYSLIAPSGDGVFGLTSTGELLEWRPPEERLLASVGVPPPPEKGGLVQVLYWPEENALAYGAKGGDLVHFDLQKRNMRICHAHNGDFYALASLDGNLITAGMSDGNLAIWRSGEDTPCETVRGPKGIVSMARTPGDQRRLMMVRADGSAFVAIAGEGRLCVEKQYPGKDYRIVFNPAEPLPQKQSASNTGTGQSIEQLEELIEGYVAELREDGESIRISERRKDLEEMGYGHLVLAVRADEAEARGDIPAALALRSELLSILPLDRAESEPIFLRHIALLEKAGLLDTAVEVLERVNSVRPGLASAPELRGIAQYADMKGNSVIVLKLEMPLETILDSANRLGVSFTHRIQLNEGAPIRTRGARISAGEIVRKLEQMRLEAPDLEIPPGRHEEALVWASQGIAKRSLVTIDLSSGEEERGLQMAFQVIPDGRDTCFIPVTLFDAGGLASNVTQNAHNASVLEARNRFRKEAQVWNLRFSRVDAETRKAIHRIANAKLAERDYHDNQ